MSVDGMCNRCKRVVAIDGELYCKNCRKLVLDEMKESGYLTPYYPLKDWKRGPGHKQSKFVEPSGAEQNGVRALEGD